MSEGWKFVRWGMTDPEGDEQGFEPAGGSATTSSSFEWFVKPAGPT